MGVLIMMYGVLANNAPNGWLEAFFKGLQVVLKSKEPIKLATGKTFTGNKMASQSLNMNGATTIVFKLMANGESQFPQDEHMRVDNLRLLTGIASDKDKTVWAGGVIDPELMNASIDISVAGVIVQKDLKLNLFLTAPEQNDTGYLSLTSPFYWLAQTDMVITFTLPDNVAVANTNLEIQAIGPGLIA